MILKKKELILTFITGIIFISYILGFIFRENHGAAETDALAHTWPAIEMFSAGTFFYTLKNYYIFGENSFPLHHILYGKILNISEVNILIFLSFLVSLIIPFIFFYILKIRYKNLDNKHLILFSSLLLISPYFRGSAFWCLTENTGYLFLILSIFFYIKYLKIKNYSNIFYITLFGSLALYSRMQLIFFLIFFTLSIFVEKKYSKLFILFCYLFLFSIPGLYLIFLWGGLILSDTGEGSGLYYFINFRSVPNTSLVILSLITFYLLPFFAINNYQVITKKIIFNFFKKFIILLLFVSLIYIIFKVDILYLSENTLGVYGQGFLVDVLYRITGKEYFFLPFSALGLLIILDYINIDKKNLLILTSLILIMSFRVHFFNEYLDPLLYIIAFTLLKNKPNFEKNLRKTSLLFSSYYIFILIGAIIY